MPLPCTARDPRYPLKHVDPRCGPLEGWSGALWTRRSPRETSFRRDIAANVPGQSRSSRNSRGSVSQGDRARPELMATHEIELDALAQTGEQRRPMSGKDRMHGGIGATAQTQTLVRVWSAQGATRSPNIAQPSRSKGLKLLRFRASAPEEGGLSFPDTEEAIGPGPVGPTRDFGGRLRPRGALGAHATTRPSGQGSSTS